MCAAPLIMFQYFPRLLFDVKATRHVSGGIAFLDRVHTTSTKAECTVGGFGALEDVGGGAYEVEGQKPWFDKDGMAVGLVQMLDLAEGMGTYREGRRL